MEDFFTFKKMITPVIIQILFWIGVGLCVILGLISIVSGASSAFGGGPAVLTGLVMLLVGPFIVRIYCELLIVIFSINDNLKEVKDIISKEKV